MARDDDFPVAVKNQMAARVNYRCSNLTCRVATTRPDPDNPGRAISIGVAAHITAASPGGARYDPAMSSDERSSISNGVWLCQTCSVVIDRSPAGYPVDALKAWKEQAERSAARDSQLTRGEVDSIIADIDVMHQMITTFTFSWKRGEPEARGTRFEADWDGFISASIAYSDDRLAAYHSQIAPLVQDLLVRAETLLGGSDPRVLKVMQIAQYAWVNYFTLTNLAEEIQRLRATLALR